MTNSIYITSQTKKNDCNRLGEDDCYSYIKTIVTTLSLWVKII